MPTILGFDLNQIPPLARVLGVVALILITAKPATVADGLTHLFQGIAWVLAIPVSIFDYIGTQAKRLLEATLRWPPDSITELSPPWAGMMVVSRLVGLVIALDIIICAAALDLASTGPVMDLGDVSLPSFIPVAAAMGLLFYGVLTLWGMLLVDLLGILPASLHLFPKLHELPKLKRIMLIISVVNIILGLVAVVILYVDRAYLLQGTPWPAAPIYISFLQAILVNTGSIPAAFMLITGIVAVVSVTCAVLWLLCAAIKLPFAELVRIVEFIGEEIVPRLINILSTPGRLLWNVVVSVPLISLFHLPRLHGMSQEQALQAEQEAGSYPGPNGRGGIGAIHRGTGSKVEVGTRIGLLQVKGGDELMRQAGMVGKVTMIGWGAVGQRLIPKLVSALKEVDGATAIRAYGICDPNRLADQPGTPKPIEGIRDISPLRGEVDAALTTTARRPQAVQIILQALIEKLIVVNKPLQQADGTIVVVADLLQIPQMADDLSKLAGRLPGHTITIITAVPEGDQGDAQTLQAKQVIEALEARHATIATTMWLDKRSPLVKATSEEQQERLFAKTFACDVVAHAHDSKNYTYAEMLQLVGSSSPHSMLAMGSVSVVSGKLVKWYKPIASLVGKPPVGHGDLTDIRFRAIDMTPRVIGDLVTRSLNLGIDVLQRSVFLTYTIPLPVQDDRFQRCTDDIRTWLANTYPSASANIVSGNGEPELGIVGPYFVQVSATFGTGPFFLDSSGVHEGTAPPTNPQATNPQATNPQATNPQATNPLPDVEPEPEMELPPMRVLPERIPGVPGGEPTTKLPRGRGRPPLRRTPPQSPTSDWGYVAYPSPF